MSFLNMYRSSAPLDERDDLFEQAAARNNSDQKNRELAEKIAKSLATQLQMTDTLTIPTTPVSAEKVAKLQEQLNKADPAQPVDNRRAILAF